MTLDKTRVFFVAKNPPEGENPSLGGQGRGFVVK